MRPETRTSHLFAHRITGRPRTARPARERRGATGPPPLDGARGALSSPKGASDRAGVRGRAPVWFVA